MYKYAAKRNEDSDGNLIGYLGVIRIEGNAKIPQKYDIILSMLLTKYPKVVLNNETWEIIEDSASKADHDDKKAQKEASRTLFANLNVSDLDTVAKMRPVVLQLAKALKELL